MNAGWLHGCNYKDTSGLGSCAWDVVEAHEVR